MGSKSVFALLTSIGADSDYGCYIEETYQRPGSPRGRPGDDRREDRVGGERETDPPNASKMSDITASKTGARQNEQKKGQ